MSPAGALKGEGKVFRCLRDAMPPAFPELSFFPYLDAKLRSVYKSEQIARQLSIHGSPPAPEVF